MQHKGLTRQGSLYVLAVLCAVAAGTVVPRLWPQAVQACTEYTRAFTENFNAVAFKDAQNSSVAGWPVGPITLPRLGSNFAVASPGSMGARIYACASGDFTGDGFPDLIGLAAHRRQGSHQLGQVPPRRTNCARRHQAPAREHPGGDRHHGG